MRMWIYGLAVPLLFAGCAGRAVVATRTPVYYEDDYYVETYPRYRPYYYERYYEPRPYRYQYVEPRARVYVRPRAPQVHVRPPRVHRPPMPHRMLPHHRRHFPG